MDANVPSLTDDGIIKLVRARHPLIDAKKIVPVDISIGKDFDVLVITGPNTGGKTVALKTLGLLTLMAMCGLMIPAGESSSVSVFGSIFADIGDEQSIEQNLSLSISHHNTIHILFARPTTGAWAARRARRGTDRRGRGPRDCDHRALKLYGAKLRPRRTILKSRLRPPTPRVENAGCEFDVTTLSRPTTAIGVPAEQRFAISERLGMDSSDVERAKTSSREKYTFRGSRTNPENSRRRSRGKGQGGRLPGEASESRKRPRRKRRSSGRPGKEMNRPASRRKK
jgi:DNA mismatch repair protein MutS2